MEKKTILIVEDDADTAMGLSVRLVAGGYATVTAADSKSGIHLALRERPDLILLDLGLPDDNGFVMMKKMADIKQLSSIPVIVVTGRSPQVYKEPVRIAGAMAYLQKPIDIDELLAVIQKTLSNLS
jgi:two-component system KDP operon response regulator KdpE